MSDKTETSYSLSGNNAFLNYLRRFRTADICAQFFRSKVKDSSDILDCGCGPGSVTLGLAEWASSGKTVGIDLNGEQFENARESAKAKGISNVEFREANIFDLPFEDNQFDFVFAQAIFIHIPDHSKAVSEIRRDPMAEKLRMIYRKGMIATGGDPDVGLSLSQLLLDSEFEELELSIAWEQSPNHEFRAEYFANLVDVFDNGKLGQLAVSQGWVTTTERQQIGKACRDLANNPAAIWGIPFVQALARKP